MKLALPLLLLTLALCCSDANAEVCPALASEVSSFLLDSKAAFNENIKQFDAPPEAKQAKLRVKTCVDKIPRVDRLAVARFVKKVNLECKRQFP